MTVEKDTGGNRMADKGAPLYACCPKCGKPIGRAMRCDGMELNCSKCGSELRMSVDADKKVSVELVNILSTRSTKPNMNSVAPRNAGLG